jgi:3-deoxy-D-manno-octulosonic-acid transferase
MLFYRLILLVAAPVLALRFLLHQFGGKMRRGALAERLGHSSGAAILHKGAVVWVHGSSLGELTGARAMLDLILSRDPDLHIVITMNTETAHKMVTDWGLERVDVVLAPLDYRFALKRFLARWQPALLITIENEIWPNRFELCHQAGIPVTLLGARMSEKSARIWARLGGLPRRVFDRISLISAQDRSSEARLVTLGVRSNATAPLTNLKSGVSVPAGDTQEMEELRAVFPYDCTLLAASTHPGEEAQILAAYNLALKKRPQLRLILAPRHPGRADEIAGMISGVGLSSRRRSRGETPEAGAVFLADTLGEMALWYQLAALTFVGGSLVHKGGHTPFEPVQFGSVVLHGPDVSNHGCAYQALASANAAVRISSEWDMASMICSLSADSARREGMRLAATEALAALRRDDTALQNFVDRAALLSGIYTISTGSTESGAPEA